MPRVVCALVVAWALVACQSSPSAIDASAGPGDAALANDAAVDARSAPDAALPVDEAWSVVVAGPSSPTSVYVHALAPYGDRVVVIGNPAMTSYDADGGMHDEFPWTWPWSSNPAVYRRGARPTVRQSGELALLVAVTPLPGSVEVREFDANLAEVRTTVVYEPLPPFGAAMAEIDGQIRVLVERDVRGLELLTIDDGAVVNSRVIDGETLHIFGALSMAAVGSELLVCLSRADGQDDVYFELLRIAPSTGAYTTLPIALYQDVAPQCELIETPAGIAVVYSDYEQLHAGLLDADGTSWIVPPAPTHPIDSEWPRQFAVVGSRLVGMDAPYLFPISLPDMTGEPIRMLQYDEDSGGGLHEAFTSVNGDAYAALRFQGGSGSLVLKRLAPW